MPGPSISTRMDSRRRWRPNIFIWKWNHSEQFALPLLSCACDIFSSLVMSYIIYLIHYLCILNCQLCAEMLFTVLWGSRECVSYWKEEHYCSHFLWIEKGLNKWQRTVGGRASVQPERKWNEKVQSGRPLIHHDKWERPRPRGYLIAHGGLCAPARPHVHWHNNKPKQPVAAPPSAKLDIR